MISFIMSAHFWDSNSFLHTVVSYINKPRRTLLTIKVVGFNNVHISLQQQSQPVVDNSSDNVDFAIQCILMETTNFTVKSMYRLILFEPWFNVAYYNTKNNNVFINFRLYNFENWLNIEFIFSCWGIECS